MRLIFLHGAPATGKLTTAMALNDILPSRIFDNHSAIDAARTVFDFGAPGFWDLVHIIRLSVLEAAAKHDVPIVISTNCYAHPEDLSLFEAYEDVLNKHGAELLPVFLHCAEAEMIRRVGNPERVQRRKIISESGLRQYNSVNNLTSVPRDNVLTLDSGTRTAKETAREIIRHFRLS